MSDTMRTRAEQVTLTAVVERRVKLTVAGRSGWKMSQLAMAGVLVVEAETVDRDVARDRDHAAGGHLVEGLGPTQLAAQSIERVVAEDLRAMRCRALRRPVPHEQHQLADGHGAQEVARRAPVPRSRSSP